MVLSCGNLNTQKMKSPGEEVSVTSSSVNTNDPLIDSSIFQQQILELTKSIVDAILNSDEVPDNGIDDDNNGFVDDTYGWVTGEYDRLQDEHGHGTHVAGTIAARNNNEGSRCKNHGTTVSG